MPLTGRAMERHAPSLALKIEVTASCQELLRDGRIPILGREEQRRGAHARSGS